MPAGWLGYVSRLDAPVVGIPRRRAALPEGQQSLQMLRLPVCAGVKLLPDLQRQPCVSANLRRRFFKTHPEHSQADMLAPMPLPELPELVALGNPARDAPAVGTLVAFMVSWAATRPLRVDGSVALGICGWPVIQDAKSASKPFRISVGSYLFDSAVGINFACRYNDAAHKIPAEFLETPASYPGSELPRGYFCAVTPP